MHIIVCSVGQYSFTYRGGMRVHGLNHSNASSKPNCTPLVYLVAPDPACVQDSSADEIMVGFIIIIIVIFTYCRLYHVWQTKLNFTEVNIF